MSCEPPPVVQHAIPPADTRNRNWRVVALMGVAATLAMALFQSFPLEPRQSRGVLFAGILVLVTLAVLRTLFRPAWQLLSSKPDILVPVGVALLASTAVDLLARLPLLHALLMPSWSLNLLGLALSLSLGTVLSIVIWTAFAAWQTDLILRAVRSTDVLDVAPWPPIRQHFLRTFVVLMVGVGVLLASIVPAVALGAATLILALPAMGVIGVVWNLLTAALLPVVLLSPSPLPAALREGFRYSWSLKGRWWRQLVAHLLLLGILLFLRVHFTSTVQRNDPGRRVVNMNQQAQTSVKWQVNAFWTGGYENGCRWYSKYAEAIETQPLPIISQVLAILFLVVALAMKITVVRELPCSGKDALEVLLGTSWENGSMGS